MKRQPASYEKIFANSICSMFRIHKGLSNSIIKITQQTQITQKTTQ
jgi:hypothetical protein